MYVWFYVIFTDSEQDVRLKASNRHKRFIMPKQLTSSDSNEYLNDKSIEIKKPVSLLFLFCTNVVLLHLIWYIYCFADQINTFETDQPVRE